MSDADTTAPQAANDNDLFNVVEAANFLRLKRSTLDHIAVKAGARSIESMARASSTRVPV